MVVTALVLLLITPEPAPSAPALKTIIIERSTPLCTNLKAAVLYAIGGLQANDRLIESAKPLLLQTGKDYLPISEAGQSFGRPTRFGGVHDPSPALILDGERLNKITGAIIRNLALIDAVLNDPSRFPVEAKTADDQKELALKSQLRAIADQQRGTLNTLYGLTDTLALQQLVAKGDGLQGATNEGNARVAQSDQDVSFQDVLSAASRGRGVHIDPTVDQDPAISQPPTDLTNNPMKRFYLGVFDEQKRTAQAENELTQNVVSAAAACR